VKEDPNSMANGRFYCLVALRRFHYVVALGRFYCLVALGRFHCWVGNGRRKNNTFLPLPTFPQQILLKPLIFLLTLRSYFTMVLGRYLCIPFLSLDL
jgi:hypothetical protein